MTAREAAEIAIERIYSNNRALECGAISPCEWSDNERDIFNDFSANFTSWSRAESLWQRLVLNRA